MLKCPKNIGFKWKKKKLSLSLTGSKDHQKMKNSVLTFLFVDDLMCLCHHLQFADEENKTQTCRLHEVSHCSRAAFPESWSPLLCTNHISDSVKKKSNHKSNL